MKDEFKINVDKNKSTTYMLPFVNSELNLEFKYKMLNSYLSFEENDNIFCILYDWSSDQKFLEFEGELMKNDMFMGHEDYGNKCLYKFRLNNKMLAGRDSFIEGNHSEFSINHKECIKSYLKDMNAPNIINITQILSPDSIRVSSKPNMRKETFLNNLTIIKTKSDKLYESN
jgi:hypothetical protein